MIGSLWRSGGIRVEIDLREPKQLEQLIGRKIVGIEFDPWDESVDGRDWIGIRFDGGGYLSVEATPSYGEPAHLTLATKRRCPEPVRRERTGEPWARCRHFEGHQGPHGI